MVCLGLSSQNTKSSTNYIMSIGSESSNTGLLIQSNSSSDPAPPVPSSGNHLSPSTAQPFLTEVGVGFSPIASDYGMTKTTFHTPSFGDEEFDIPPIALSSYSGPISQAHQTLYSTQPLTHHPSTPQPINGTQPLTHHPRSTVSPVYSQGQQQPPVYSQNRNSIPDHNFVVPKFPPQNIDIPAITSQGYSHFNNSSQGLVGYHQHPHPQQVGYHINGVYPPQHPHHHQLYSSQQLNYNNQQQHRIPNNYGSNQHQQQQQQQQHLSAHQREPRLTSISPKQNSDSNSGQQVANGSSQGVNSKGMDGRSPTNSSNTSPGRESSEDSDDSLPLAQVGPAQQAVKRSAPESPAAAVTNANNGVSAPKKPKTPKKRKKKDPNEPHKPVSAYALFFRDTQAAIRGQSPNASFGEVSKIVASMWDNLDADQKSEYKKKTETAKKEYLKQLAAYRASLVSKQSSDPLDHQYTQAGDKGQQSAMMQQKNMLPPNTMSNMSPQMMPNLSPNPPNAHMSPPHLSHLPPSDGHMMAHQASMANMHQVGHPGMGGGPMPHQQGPGMSPLGHQQPPGMPNPGPGHMGSTMHMNNQAPQYAMDGRMTSPQPNMCIRNGCQNQAISNPAWDNEYCSNDCVVSHCRDVFTAWVAARQTTNSYASVK